MIDSQAGRYGFQVCVGRFDGDSLALCVMKTQKRLLRQVLGFGDTAQHAVRNPKARWRRFDRPGGDGSPMGRLVISRIKTGKS